MVVLPSLQWWRTSRYYSLLWAVPRDLCLSRWLSFRRLDVAGCTFWRVDIFFFQAEDGIRDGHVTGVQTCALPIYGDYRLLVLSGGDDSAANNCVYDEPKRT